VLAADEAQEVLGLRQRPTEAQGDDPTDEGPLQRVIDRALVKERAGQLSAHPAWVAGRRRSRWVDRVTGDPWPAMVRYVALGRRPAEGLRRRWSLLARYLPELAALRRLPGGPHHRVDPLEHTFRVLEGLPEASAQLGYHLAAGPAVLAEHLVQEIPGRGSWPALTRGQLLRVAGLFHDIGKAPTCAGENETVTFHGHETAGAELWAALAQRHGLPPAQTEHVERLIRLHLRPLALFGAPDRSAKAVRGLVTDAGDALPDLLLLFRSDLTADPLEPVDAGAVLSFVTALSAEAKALRAASAAEAPAITGDELLAAGLAPGPGFGAALKAAQAAARADPALDREALLRVAKEAYSIGTKTQN
jgi:putative nucleotidyltransferase with HDIG domain